MTATLSIIKVKIRPIYIIVLIVFAVGSIMMMTATSYPILWTYFDKFYHLGGFIYMSSIILYIILPLILPNYRKVGFISIDNTGIKVFNNNVVKEYSLDRIQQIKFVYNNTVLDGGYGVVIGISNYLSIKDFYGKVDKYRLQIYNFSILRFIDEKLDYLGNDIEIIKIKKGKRVERLIDK